MARIADIYAKNTNYIKFFYERFCAGASVPDEIYACYPEVRFTLRRSTRINPGISHGFLEAVGEYTTTITRPDLFSAYLNDQMTRIITAHNIDVEIGVSSTRIPAKFVDGYDDISVSDFSEDKLFDLNHHFTPVDIGVIDDSIADGSYTLTPGMARPLSLFSAPRIDLALERLHHYTGSSPADFQSFIILTNYAFHVDFFCDFAFEAIQQRCSPHGHADVGDGYGQFCASTVRHDRSTLPSNSIAVRDEIRRALVGYQMPACHLTRPDHLGISIVNIGVGPSNAKTLTDCLAVLRPHCWLMVGHCAGLDARLHIGDMILANAYERQDYLLDRHVPLGKPIPSLAEVQAALAGAYQASVKSKNNWIKDHMRTGTVLTVADRNWEWRPLNSINRDLQQSTAIAVDMESATVATNGYRFRIPYGALLSVSDKPLHNQPKLPRSARRFYETSRAEHILTALYGLEAMRLDIEALHSRKLRRAIGEVAFR